MNFRRSAVSISTLSNFTLSSFILSILAAHSCLRSPVAEAAKAPRPRRRPLSRLRFATGSQCAPPLIWRRVPRLTSQPLLLMTARIGVSHGRARRHRLAELLVPQRRRAVRLRPTAPATVPSTNPITIIATSAADTSVSAHAMITITSSPVIAHVPASGQQYAPPTSLATSATAQIAAIVTTTARILGLLGPARRHRHVEVHRQRRSGAATVYTAPATARRAARDDYGDFGRQQ